MVNQNILRTCELKQSQIKFATEHDQNKCLKQGKLSIYCAPISELPSNMSTMIVSDNTEP